MATVAVRTALRNRACDDCLTCGGSHLEPVIETILFTPAVQHTAHAQVVVYLVLDSSRAAQAIGAAVEGVRRADVPNG